MQFFLSLCIILIDRYLDPLASAGLFKDITLIVDGTDCPIHRPGTREQRNVYTNGRNKENILSRYVFCFLQIRSFSGTISSTLSLVKLVLGGFVGLAGQILAVCLIMAL